MSKLCKGILAFILIIAITYDFPTISAKGETVIINTKSLNVRTGPGLTYPVTASLKMGDKVEIVSSSGDWHEIKVGSRTGWIASWLVVDQRAVGSAKRTAVSKVNALNIRLEPSTSAAVIGQLMAGDAVEVTGLKGEWASISKNGNNGWVHTDYITEISHSESGQAATISKQQPTKTEQFTVSVDALNVRIEPNLSSKKIGLIRNGETFPVVQVDGNWVKIKLDNKTEAWAYSFHGVIGPKNTIESTTSKGKNVTVLTNGTNIRQSATTSSNIVKRANAGEVLTVVEEANDWYKVALNSGETAFIAKWVVSSGEVTKADLQSNGGKSNRTAGTLKGLTIVVDAGHGGNDHGTTGLHGTDEKLLTLLTAQSLAAKLKAAGANVILTRDSDTYISLRKRVSINMQASADAFISIHYDANPDTSITGFTTYYTNSNQKALAAAVNSGLESSINLRNRGVQSANYLVLRENKKNSILVELGFLSNPSEERILTTEKFREQATHGIYQGLIKYFDKN
ncbi:SH3 domain-containing protein [Sporosarcina highlanderae]|uniref:SH3 domain-containing protein n=1 Tax=Sporosarcina highlanderae TaxID=3035916 RepID=A0ABT8JQ09_9BACL|nr:SH3 domain-containing protein [Sporosarcina highlanderae]MDN4607107.1 SH3 domain-containing protein [Sporosarcina highlanderae]